MSMTTVKEFFGRVLKSGEHFELPVETDESVSGTLHITTVTLPSPKSDSRVLLVHIDKDEEGEDDDGDDEEKKKKDVKVRSEEEKKTVIAILQKGKLECMSTDICINLDDPTSIKNEGTEDLHLSGYIARDECMDMMDGKYTDSECEDDDDSDTGLNADDEMNKDDIDSDGEEEEEEEEKPIKGSKKRPSSSLPEAKSKKIREIPQQVEDDVDDEDIGNSLPVDQKAFAERVRKYVQKEGKTPLGLLCSKLDKPASMAKPGKELSKVKGLRVRNGVVDYVKS